MVPPAPDTSKTVRELTIGPSSVEINNDNKMSSFVRVVAINI